MSDTNPEVDAQRACNSTQSFLDLPVELVELIIESADPKDVLSLRLVSHEVAERASKPFLRHFFARRAFLLSSEESLRGLLNIVENQKLARGLHTVDLCISTLR